MIQFKREPHGPLGTRREASDRHLKPQFSGWMIALIWVSALLKITIVGCLIYVGYVLLEHFGVL